MRFHERYRRLGLFALDVTEMRPEQLMRRSHLLATRHAPLKDVITVRTRDRAHARDGAPDARESLRHAMMPRLRDADRELPIARTTLEGPGNGAALAVKESSGPRKFKTIEGQDAMIERVFDENKRTTARI